MTLILKKFIAALAIVCVAPCVADAGLILGLQYSDGSTTKTVSSGDAIFVNLLLTYTGADLTTLAPDGLITAGGRIFQPAGAIALTPGAVTNPGGLWDLSFDTTAASSGPGLEVGKVATAAIFAVVPTLSVSAPLDTILIASFAFTATGAPASTATLTADILDPAGIGDFLLTDIPSLTLLDRNPGLSFGSISLAISGSAAAVPEPGSMLFCSVVATCAGVTSWRRRRRSTASLARKS